MVEAIGEVVYERPGVVILRGMIVSGDRTLFNDTGVLKKLKARPEGERTESRQLAGSFLSIRYTLVKVGRKSHG